MLEVKFSGNNLGEIQNQVREFLLAQANPPITIRNPAPVQEVTVTITKEHETPVSIPVAVKSKHTLASLRLQFVELLKANMTGAVKLLGEYGVAKISDLTEENFEAFSQDVTKLMGEK
jgi:hypothetical protein